MLIKLTNAEILEIVTNHLKRANTKQTVKSMKAVITEHVGADIIEKPMENMFSHIYFELI